MGSESQIPLHIAKRRKLEEDIFYQNEVAAQKQSALGNRHGRGALQNDDSK